jgi:hypothetical protein
MVESHTIIRFNICLVLFPMLEAGRSRDRLLMSLNCFHLSNPSSFSTALGLIHRLRELSTRNVVGGKGRPAPSVSRLSTKCLILDVSQPCRPPQRYWDSFILWRRSVLPVRYELDCKYCYK